MLSLLMSTPCALSGGRRAVLKSGSSFALGALALRTVPAAYAADELPKVGGKPVMAPESIMAQKAHGTSASPVQANLKWNVDGKKADQITNFNRRFAEYGGYWKETSFLKEVSRDEPTTYYDSVTGKPLFVAPRGRSMDDFLKDSQAHGWPWPLTLIPTLTLALALPLAPHPDPNPSPSPNPNPGFGPNRRRTVGLASGANPCRNQARLDMAGQRASQPADWPRRAGAWGSLGRGVTLREASGETPSREVVERCHLCSA